MPCYQCQQRSGPGISVSNLDGLRNHLAAILTEPSSVLFSQQQPGILEVCLSSEPGLCVNALNLQQLQLSKRIVN